jgi:hypothetical protein
MYATAINKCIIEWNISYWFTRSGEHNWIEVNRSRTCEVKEPLRNRIISKRLRPSEIKMMRLQLWRGIIMRLRLRLVKWSLWLHSGAANIYWPHAWWLIQAVLIVINIAHAYVDYPLHWLLRSRIIFFQPNFALIKITFSFQLSSYVHYDVQVWQHCLEMSYILTNCWIYN